MNEARTLVGRAFVWVASVTQFMAVCDFCGGRADFVRHREQHLNGEVVDICKACHMRLHVSLCRGSRINGQSFIRLEGAGSFVTASFRLPKVVLEPFQEWCRGNGISYGLALNIAMELFVKSEDLLPWLSVDDLDRLVAVGFRRWVEGARRALDHYEPPVYYSLEVLVDSDRQTHFAMSHSCLSHPF